MSASGQASITDAEVWIPWRHHSSRIPALKHVVGWWKDHGFTVNLIDTSHEPFNLAACRNHAVRNATSHVVILADADTLPDIDPLLTAITLAAEERGTVLPYTTYRSLGAHGSVQALHGRPLDQCKHYTVDGACSGIYVTTRAGWAKHHGQDELFAGWGCEDAAWWITHETLLGQPQRVDGNVYALTHESQDKTGEPTRSNYARIYLYEQAAGNPAEINRLATQGTIRG